MKKVIVFAIVVVVAGYFGAKWHLHGKVRDSVDSAVDMARPFATIRYDGISSTLSGELTVDGVRATVKGFRDEIYIERIGIDTPSFLSLLALADVTKKAESPEDALPGYFGLIAEGMRVPVNADYFRALYDMHTDAYAREDGREAATECVGKYGFSPATLAALGYDAQVVSMRAVFREEGSRFRMEMHWSTADMWDFDVDMTFVGSMWNELSRGIAFRPKMSNMSIRYTDRSLKQRVRRLCGERGLSDEEIVAAQLDAFQYIGESNGIEFDDYVMGPYREFLDGKSTLVFTAKPSEPVALSQIGLYKPSDVPALLDLSASAL